MPKSIFVFLVSLIASTLSFSVSVSADDFIACESSKGNRQYCRVGGAENSAIRLHKQLSGAACNEGSSWGRDQYGIWVDKGCRAEFIVIRKQQQQQQVQETCPSGHRPGRCGDKERRRGCKDFRMPGGLGCRTN